MFTIILFVTILVLIYIFLTWNMNYWSKRGIRGPKTRMVVGSYSGLLTGKQHMAEDSRDIYNEYKKSETIVGTFMFRSPVLLLIDPQQVNDVLVTSFNNFHDNDSSKLFNIPEDSLFKHNPFVLTGEKWREIRAIVTPGLTSMRMKASYPDMVKVAQSLCDYIEEQSINQEWINGRDLTLRFTVENISQSVLGIDSRSFSDTPLPIVEHIRLLEENFVLNYFTLFVTLFPELGGLMKVQFAPNKFEIFFKHLMKNVFTMRRQVKMERQDYLNYLLSLSEKKGLEDSILYSHLMTFLVDGLETSSKTLGHTLLLLGANPMKQRKLYEELLYNMNENGSFDFEKLTELPYLDACVHETLRIYPAALFLLKTCTADYEFTNKDQSKTKIYKGECVHIPVYSIHLDEDIYPNPSEFQPERFMPDNGGVKKYRDMGVFLGFSSGPRICIGMRFALLQIKLALATILTNFEVKSHPSIDIPKLNSRSLIAMQDGELSLKFVKYQK